jgi:K+-sensing histidine kinase KdpD
VDERLEDMMREAARAPQEKVLLLLSDGDHDSRSLIREGWRLAEALHAELLVGFADRNLAEANKQELAKTLELAEDLNGRIVRLPDLKAQSIAATAAREGAGHIVLRGQPGRVLGRSLQELLVEALRKAGAHVHLHVLT